MTTAYLKPLEITRRLGLPDKLGRIAWETWQFERSFPKAVDGMGGRWFLPQVEQWLLARHGVSGQTTQYFNTAPVPLPGNKGENFDGFTSKHTVRPKRARTDIPTPPERLGNVVVATIGPQGARLPGKSDQAVAVRLDPAPAE